MECKKRTKLDVLHDWFEALLNLYGVKKAEVWIPNLRGHFLITRTDCLRQYDHNSSEVMEPNREPGFFIIITGREGSSLLARMVFHASVNYPPLLKKKLANTLYMEKVIISLISMFVGHMNLQNEGCSETSFTD